VRELHKYLTAVFILILTQSANAAKTTIAILDFETNDVSAKTAEICTDAVSRTIVGTNRYNVVVRDEMARILEEQGFQIMGCTTTECAVKQGKLIGARLVLFGNVSKIGSIYKVDLRIVDVELGTAIDAKDRDVNYETDLEDASAETALELIGAVPTVGSIVEVDEPYYYVDLGRMEGVTTDTILKVVRKGEVVYHEGEPLIKKQLDVCYLQVEDTEEGGCETVIAETGQLRKTRSPEAGDLVTITDYSRSNLGRVDYETSLRYRLKFFGFGGYQAYGWGVIGAAEGAFGIKVGPSLAFGGGITYKLGRDRSRGLSFEFIFTKSVGNSGVLETDIGTFHDRSYSLISLYVVYDVYSPPYDRRGIRISLGGGLDKLTAQLRQSQTGPIVSLSAVGAGVIARIGFPLLITGAGNLIPTVTAKHSFTKAESGDIEATVSGATGGITVEF
jgi:hypothetical protein